MVDTEGWATARSSPHQATPTTAKVGDAVPPVPAVSAIRARPGQHPVPPRRWSLRARLIALVVATAAIALLAVNIALPLVVRDAAITAKDATLASVINAVSRSRVNAQDLSDLSNLAQLRGEIGWSTVSDAGISEVEVPTVSEPGANPDVSATTEWLTEAVTVRDSRDGDTRYRAQGV